MHYILGRFELSVLSEAVLRKQKKKKGISVRKSKGSKI
jgi:hypothetical protein